MRTGPKSSATKPNAVSAPASQSSPTRSSHPTWPTRVGAAARAAKSICTKSTPGKKGSSTL